MYRDALFDELRNIERDVIEGERQLANKEALVLELKTQNQDTTKAQADLEVMRNNQRCREQDRQRILSLLQP